MITGSNPPRPEDIERAWSTMLGATVPNREYIQRRILEAGTEAEAISRLREHHNGAGVSPAHIGETAHEYQFDSSGLSYWFGSSPNHWRCLGFWNGWSADPNRMYIMRLFYTLDDVPKNRWRYVRITFAEAAKKIRREYAQPPLLEMGA